MTEGLAVCQQVHRVPAVPTRSHGIVGIVATPTCAMELDGGVAIAQTKVTTAGLTLSVVRCSSSWAT